MRNITRDNITQAVIGSFGGAEGSPALPVGGDLIRSNDGEPVLVRGRVLDQAGAPIPGATPGDPRIFTSSSRRTDTARSPRSSTSTTTATSTRTPYSGCANRWCWRSGMAMRRTGARAASSRPFGPRNSTSGWMPRNGG